MWAMSVLGIVTAVLILLAPGPQGTTDPRGEMHFMAQAQNFVIYRNTVNQYVLDNPAMTGVVADADIDLGPWQKGSWQNLSTGSAIYVYGPLDAASGLEVVRQVGKTSMLGWKRSGNLISPANGDMGAMPSIIPDGSFVSVIAR